MPFEPILKYPIDGSQSPEKQLPCIVIAALFYANENDDSALEFEARGHRGDRAEHPQYLATVSWRLRIWTGLERTRLVVFHHYANLLDGHAAPADCELITLAERGCR